MPLPVLLWRVSSICQRNDKRFPYNNFPSSHCPLYHCNTFPHEGACGEMRTTLSPICGVNISSTVIVKNMRTVTSNKQHLRLLVNSLPTKVSLGSSCHGGVVCLYDLFFVLILFNHVNSLFYIPQHQVAMTVICLPGISR